MLHRTKHATHTATPRLQQFWQEEILPKQGSKQGIQEIKTHVNLDVYTL
jgi:hypothetical protein